MVPDCLIIISLCSSYIFISNSSVKRCCFSVLRVTSIREASGFTNPINWNKWKGHWLSVLQSSGFQPTSVGDIDHRAPVISLIVSPEDDPGMRDGWSFSWCEHKLSYTGSMATRLRKEMFWTYVVNNSFNRQSYLNNIARSCGLERAAASPWDFFQWIGPLTIVLLCKSTPTDS